MDDVYMVINGQVRFDGDCSVVRPFCGAICCKSRSVLLSQEEKDSGSYDYVEPTEGCNCTNCQIMRERNAVLLRRNNNGCVYLDGSGRCTIYDRMPEACKNFECESTWWALVGR